MAMTDIPGYIMGHRFSDDPADYDSVNKRWHDKSPYAGRGGDITVTVGDPASKFANVASANNRRGLLFDNTWQGTMPSPIPWMGSVIVVAKIQNLSGTATRTVLPAIFGDSTTLTVNGSIAFTFASPNRQFRLSGPNWQLVAGPQNRSDDNTRVTAASFDQQTRLSYITGDGVSVTTAAAPASSTNGNALTLGSALTGVRVGNMSGVAGDTAAITDFNAYIFEWHWFKGNVLAGATLSQVATEIAALKSFYGAS
jgi:hypothetical protein